MDQEQDKKQQINIPESYYCPILQTLMKDPVIDPEGNTYERSAIEDWLTKNNTSPITRNPLDINDLAPNRALRESIEQLRQQFPQESLEQFQKQANKNPAIQQQQQEQNQKEDIQQQQQQQQQIEEEKEPVKQVPLEDNSDNVQLKVTNFNEFVKVQITPPNTVDRNPADIVCVIDISGSMDDDATVKDDQNKKEVTGLIILDVVKHAVKTIISNLQGKDRLSIIAYDDKAEVVLGLTNMDNKGQKKAFEQLEKLQPRGQTNLWDGLYQGLEMIKNNVGLRRDAIQTVLLLTDGQPNVIPPRGHIPMLKMYKDQNPISCTVNTFGFGYNLDSELLEQIALETDGQYCFIPDSSFVGTIFVNNLANILTTMARTVTLSLETLNGSKIVNQRILGGYECKPASWGMEVQIGTLNLGQSKDIVFQMEYADQKLPYLGVTLKYENISEIKQKQKYLEVKDKHHDPEVQVHGLRLQMIDTVTEQIKLMRKKQSLATSQQQLKQFIQVYKNTLQTPNKLSTDTLTDLEGQITEAFSKQEFYDRWGRHFLPSLLRAHQAQVCNNFKDPGVQNYGGLLFQQIRDLADATFMKLPPPKASKKIMVQQGNQKVYQVPKQVNIQRYNNCNYGCIDGDCTVLMKEGHVKSIKDIKMHDLVITDEKTGAFSKVVCVIKTNFDDGKAHLVELEGGLLLTQYHPVFVNEEWHFPVDLVEAQERQCKAVYSFILEQGHTLIVNGVKCAAMGHNMKGNVIEHAYFGTQKVVDDLRKMRGWEDGLVELKKDCFVRDQISGLVIKMIQE